MGNLVQGGLEQLEAYLGRTLDASEKATARLHLTHTANMVRAYTRGQGFDATFPDVVDDALIAVIISRTVRTMHNPTDLVSWSSSGIAQRPGRTAWTLAELAVLDRFKRSTGSIPAQ